MRISASVLACCMIALLLLPANAHAQGARARGGGLYGDYLVTMQLGEREFESILSFSRSSEGQRTGQWISFMGVSDLQDLTFEEGKLSFKQVRQNREGEEMTSTFTGTLAEGKLSGTMTGQQGETKIEGTRMPRTPRLAGIWNAQLKMGEREFTSTLVVKAAGEEGQLAVEWQSERVQHTISDVTYERGTLTFKAHSKMEEREWDSTFEGRLEEEKLTGTIKSERGEITLEATRAGGPAIGTWNLVVASERGERKQRLRVNSDLSAWYGSTHVDKVSVEDGKVSFKISMQFGERTFEISFAGSIADTTLTGELTTSRGTQKVTGTKVVRPPMPRRTREA